MAVTRTLTLTTLHGETDRAAETQRSHDVQLLSGVPRDKLRDPPCEVIAVFTGDGIDPVAVNFSDWDEVAGLKQGATAVLTIGK